LHKLRKMKVLPLHLQRQKEKDYYE